MVAPVAFVQRTDDHVLHWSVVEVDAATVPGARGSHCLVFTREDCVRRVWDYPADWQSLDDEGSPHSAGIGRPRRRTPAHRA